MADQGDAEADQVVGRQVRQDVPSTSLSRNAGSYCARPSCCSQLATSIAISGPLHQGDPASAARTTTAIGPFNLALSPPLVYG